METLVALVIMAGVVAVIGYRLYKKNQEPKSAPKPRPGRDDDWKDPNVRHK